jgi:hypothetical protein
MLMSRAGTSRRLRYTAADVRRRTQSMEPRKLSPITIGIAGAAGTSGIGIVVSRLPTGQGGVMVTCLVLAMSFTVTSLTALGLILNYRLGKLALRVQA